MQTCLKLCLHAAGLWAVWGLWRTCVVGGVLLPCQLKACSQWTSLQLPGRPARVWSSEMIWKLFVFFQRMSSDDCTVDPTRWHTVWKIWAFETLLTSEVRRVGMFFLLRFFIHIQEHRIHLMWLESITLHKCWIKSNLVAVQLIRSGTLKLIFDFKWALPTSTYQTTFGHIEIDPKTKQNN